MDVWKTRQFAQLWNHRSANYALTTTCCQSSRRFVVGSLFIQYLKCILYIILIHISYKVFFLVSYLTLNIITCWSHLPWVDWKWGQTTVQHSFAGERFWMLSNDLQASFKSFPEAIQAGAIAEIVDSAVLCSLDWLLVKQTCPASW